LLSWSGTYRYLHSFPPRRSSDLSGDGFPFFLRHIASILPHGPGARNLAPSPPQLPVQKGAGRDESGSPSPLAQGEMSRPEHPLRSEEHTSELQSRENLVCRLLLE